MNLVTLDGNDDKVHIFEVWDWSLKK
jgi:hypothetical protein